MSDLGDTFKAWDEEKRAKKRDNALSSLKILDDKLIPYSIVNTDNTHVRVGAYDFWPSTGLFMHRKSRCRGRGVFRLLGKLGYL